MKVTSSGWARKKRNGGHTPYSTNSLCIELSRQLWGVLFGGGDWDLLGPRTEDILEVLRTLWRALEVKTITSLHVTGITIIGQYKAIIMDFYVFRFFSDFLMVNFQVFWSKSRVLGQIGRSGKVLGFISSNFGPDPTAGCLLKGNNGGGYNYYNYPRSAINTTASISRRVWHRCKKRLSLFSHLASEWIWDLLIVAFNPVCLHRYIQWQSEQ